jgi:hypothetical protein
MKKMTLKEIKDKLYEMSLSELKNFYVKEFYCSYNDTFELLDILADVGRYKKRGLNLAKTWIIKKFVKGFSKEDLIEAMSNNDLI